MLQEQFDHHQAVFQHSLVQSRHPRHVDPVHFNVHADPPQQGQNSLPVVLLDTLFPHHLVRESYSSLARVLPGEDTRTAGHVCCSLRCRPGCSLHDTACSTGRGKPRRLGERPPRGTHHFPRELGAPRASQYKNTATKVIHRLTVFFPPGPDLGSAGSAARRVILTNRGNISTICQHQHTNRDHKWIRNNIQKRP